MLMFLIYIMEVYVNLKILIWYKRGYGYSWFFFLNNVKKCGYNINYNLFLNIKVE